ncbi:hypothetical protein KSP39_PZI009139 [Platanthera zijinensis]|uniref:Small auxin up regulated protein n=1 Tax=Platanthera zijinensis TaxID=2320716 RepID=A0AAP0G7X3_9ASPA
MNTTKRKGWSPSTPNNTAVLGCAGSGSPPPPGYLPVLVGGAEEAASERFFVRVKLLKEANIVELLEMAASEFGYRQQGVLRIPCTIQHFINTVAGIYNTGV